MAVSNNEEVNAAAKAIEDMDLPGGVTFGEETNYRIALVALAAAAQVRNMQRAVFGAGDENTGDTDD